MSVKTAVGLVPVFRSLQVLSVMVGQLEIGVRRRGEWIETPALAEQPDVNLSRSRFLKRTVVSLAATGNAYWRKFYDASGLFVISYEVLNPLAIRRHYDERGRMTYIYREVRGGRQVETAFQPNDIRHLKLLEVPGFDDGLGPIQACRAALNGHRDVANYTDNWFGDSGIPNGVLKTDSQLTKETADAMRDSFKESVADHDLAVLGYGMGYEPMFLKPADAQWLEVQQFNTTETAVMFGLPAAYLDAPMEGTSPYINSEQVDTKFAKTTLMGYVNEIEDAITADLPRGQEAKIKVGGLLRSDHFTRAKTNKIYLDSKVLTPAQVADDEGYTYEGATAE